MESKTQIQDKLMKEALEKLKKERFTASSCRFLATETLKKLGR